MSPPSEQPEVWTIRRLLGWTAERFAAAGIDSPRVDAEHLLSFALDCSRMHLYLEHDKVVNGPERSRFREVVKRRLAREPVAYIEGKRGFHALGLELRVDRRVLIPRPETEWLVDWILEDLAGPRVEPARAWEAPPPDEPEWVEPGLEPEPGPPLERAEPVVVPIDPMVPMAPMGDHETRGSSEAASSDELPESDESDESPEPPDERTVLDVGTGSGAIALAIKHARPSLRVSACDVSEDALAVARDNARRLELDVPMVRSDLLAAVPVPDAGWSVIAANLPYIREPVWRGLAPEVQRFEPRLALDGGEDGLAPIRRLVETAPGCLAPGGGLYLEIGFDQGESVPALLRQRGFVDVELRRDGAGHPRMVRGRRP